MATNSPLILDTCALLWLAAGDKTLSSTAVKKINESSIVYVSAISGFEIGIKAAKRKLKLPLPARDWFDQVIEHHGLSVLSLTLEVCVLSAGLPAFHDDPCDRFIIATAKLNELAVVTTDDKFEKYGVTVIR